MSAWTDDELAALVVPADQRDELARRVFAALNEVGVDVVRTGPSRMRTSGAPAAVGMRASNLGRMSLGLPTFESVEQYWAYSSYVIRDCAL